ncbi:MAG TPA: methyltransferase [bacterium]|jgi:predicted O-methyltransferase YrrM
MDHSPAGDAFPTSQNIMDLAMGFQKSRVLLSAFELGIFSCLGEESYTSAEVAADLDTDARATDRLMNALCALGLLTKHDGRFANTQGAARFLVQEKPEYMGNLMHSVNLWDTWSTLTDAVRHGSSVIKKDVSEREESWLDAFIAAMHWRAMKSAPQLVAMLDLNGVRRVLDVGGGSGAYAMAFARAQRDIEAVVFDLPKVVPLTRMYIEREGMADRIHTVEGNYKTDMLGSGFDLIFLSAIVHSNSFAENRALLQKCAAALRPRGQVVVVDFVMDEDRITPPFGTFFSLNMLVGTEAGDTYTEPEIRSWLQDAGLSAIARKDTPFGPSMLMGRARG